jgi:hypothetical protein
VIPIANTNRVKPHPSHRYAAMVRAEADVHRAARRLAFNRAKGRKGADHDLACLPAEAWYAVGLELKEAADDEQGERSTFLRDRAVDAFLRTGMPLRSCYAWAGKEWRI